MPRFLGALDGRGLELVQPAPVKLCSAPALSGVDDVGSVGRKGNG